VAEGSAGELIRAARVLATAVDHCTFSAPVTHVLNPLDYAWAPYAAYLGRFATGPRRVVFLGMNPGPFGMVQVGVPFGEVAAVRDWMGITAPVAQPRKPNPHRPVEGFACGRSEVSGRRLWALFRERFGTAEAFFADHLVLNYCPLAFFDRGRNVTPDKLPAHEAGPLFEACDAHLRAAVEALATEWLIGIGKFAAARAERALASSAARPRIASILHPSPASPVANRGWAQAALRELVALGIWQDDARLRL